MYILDLCNSKGVTDVFSLIKTGLQIMRLIVPIGLILMTSVDLFKKVINPNDKDGQRKIIIRIIASILVFFVPLLIDFTINIIGGATGYKDGPCYSAWQSASPRWL
jgi:hypothetical protein